MAKRVKEPKRAVVHTLDGYGATMGEARAAAAARVDRLMADLRRGPEIVTWQGLAALVYRDCNGWVYARITDDAGVCDGKHRGVNAMWDTTSRDTAVATARLALTKLAWSHGCGDDLDYIDRAFPGVMCGGEGAASKAKGLLRSWIYFQRGRAACKAAGDSDATAFHHAALTGYLLMSDGTRLGCAETQRAARVHMG